MLLIARRTALAAALLLVMPLTVWLSGWLWQPGLPVATESQTVRGITSSSAAARAVRRAINSIFSPSPCR